MIDGQIPWVYKAVCCQCMLKIFMLTEITMTCDFAVLCCNNNSTNYAVIITVRNNKHHLHSSWQGSIRVGISCAISSNYYACSKYQHFRVSHSTATISSTETKLLMSYLTSQNIDGFAQDYGIASALKVDEPHSCSKPLFSHFNMYSQSVFDNNGSNLPNRRHSRDFGLFPHFIMTSSNGNIFRVTGHLCGEFTGHRWIPRTKASDAELWCFLWSAPE